MNLRPIEKKQERKGFFGNSPRMRIFLTYVGYLIMLGILALIGYGIYYFFIE